MSDSLTHLDAQGRPRMVDVSGKAVTQRAATAEATVRFTEEAWPSLKAQGFTTKKGAVGDVARIAGTMAAKRTADLIPFCHTLPLDGCELSVEPAEDEPLIRITCTVKVTARTGVEMEALTGASVAALTVYDMTKSLGHGTVIEQVCLLEKTGGKQDYWR